MKKALLSFLFAFVGVSSWAYVDIDGIYYNLNYATYEAVVTSGDNKYTGDVVIPESVTACEVVYSVTCISSSAFSGCTGLTSVTIPNSVRIIASSAFQNCTGL